MPIYKFQHKESGEVVDVIMTIAERDDFLKENPDFFQPLCTPGYADSYRLGISKGSEGFKDVLRRIKSNHVGSNIRV